MRLIRRTILSGSCVLKTSHRSLKRPVDRARPGSPFDLKDSSILLLAVSDSVLLPELRIRLPDSCDTPTLPDFSLCPFIFLMGGFEFFRF